MLARICVLLILCCASGGYPYTALSDEANTALITSLTGMCREVVQNGTNPCYGMENDAFSRFITIISGMLGTDAQAPARGADKGTWQMACKTQEKLHDARTPPICQAASFLMAPFPLRVNAAPSAGAGAGSGAGAITPSAKGYKLVAATVHTNYDFKTSPTMQSSCRFKVPIHVLGKGIEKLYDRGLGEKIHLLWRFVEGLPAAELDSTILLFVDGTDSLFQVGPEEIVRRFQSTGSRVLFSAERSCYPMKFSPWNLNLYTRNFLWKQCASGSCSNSRYVCESMFPKAPEADPHNRWLNSGAFIGYASDILRMLRDAGTIPKDMLSQWPGYDQGLYTHMYLSRKYDIDIDVTSQLFLSFGLVGNPDEGQGRAVKLLERAMGAARDRPELAHARDGGPMWLNSRAQASNGLIAPVPGIAHFNADGKRPFSAIKRALKVWSEGHQTEESCAAYINVHTATSR